MSSHQDFAQVVGAKDDVTGQFVYAPPLARVLNESPELIAALQNAGAGANALAYRLAVNDPTYLAQLAEANKDPNIAVGEQAAQVIATANGLTSVSAAGASGVIDKAAQMAAMSDEQIKAHGAEVMRKGGIAT
jgi:hypothetical protein